VLITVDPRDRRPIYQQIADSIRALIAGGQLVEGQPLPPVRQLAGDLGVNFNTIAAAYRELRDDGLIALKHGARARVGSTTAAKRTKKELRSPLRGALTRLLLAGLPRAEILTMVQDELRGLVKGARGTRGGQGAQGAKT
jgi:GntR family transcriptional regulator